MQLLNKLFSLFLTLFSLVKNSGFNNVTVPIRYHILSGSRSIFDVIFGYDPFFIGYEFLSLELNIFLGFFSLTAFLLLLASIISIPIGIIYAISATLNKSTKWWSGFVPLMLAILAIIIGILTLLIIGIFVQSFSEYY